jgi:hypothetical protein
MTFRTRPESHLIGLVNRHVESRRRRRRLRQVLRMFRHQAEDVLSWWIA